MKKTYQKPTMTALGLLRSVTKLSIDPKSCHAGSVNPY